MKTQHYIIKDKFMNRFYTGSFTLEETLNLLNRNRIKPKDVMTLLNLPMACGVDFIGFSRENSFWIARAIK